MRSIFFYTICISFAGGIFIRSFFDIGPHETLTVFLLGLVFLVLWRQKMHLLKQKNFLSPVFLVSLILVFSSLGLFRLSVVEEKESLLSNFIGTEVFLEGVVVREPDVRERVQHLYVSIDETEEILLVSANRYHDVLYGDRISVEGVLELPESFETDLGRTFNYPGYLKARGVTHRISFAEIHTLEGRAGNIFLVTLFKGKQVFTNVIESIVSEPEVGLGEGLLLGMKRALGEDLEEVFRRTGIIHIVVLSGYNVMIVAEAIMRLLSFFFTPRARLVIGIGAIASFALLVGLSATVVRASLMAVLVLIARATGRISHVLRGLMLAGVIMLLINPYLLVYDPGFQLSFLATLGLILLAPLIEAKLQLIPTQFQIREFLTATIATQIFVSPLLLYLMGSISIISVLVNVLVLPAVPLAMLLTFVAGLVGSISIVFGQVVGFGAHLALTYIISVAEFFAKFPFAEVYVPDMPFILVVILYAGFGYFLHRLNRKGNESKEDIVEELEDWAIQEEKD